MNKFYHKKTQFLAKVETTIPVKNMKEQPYEIIALIESKRCKVN